MKTPDQEPSDGKLRSLLRDTRPAPGLPPRFQENVWRRIENNERPAQTTGWLESLAALLLKPRFAMASACALVLAGAMLGALNGTAHVRESAQDRYVTSVALTMAQ